MTQQYTPVTWQDETTSQQGTLINAERLNQMQTAHHYADGWEEVDAVPTADPSVAYHKVVYCTADSTFYRWDGTEWTADIDDDTKRLLQQEIARATAAEGELAQDIADEETRATAAETALGDRITAETSARTSADTTLGNRITAETTAREGADSTLGNRITAEETRATQAEQTNAQAIATHVADKQNPHEVTKAQVGLGNCDNTSDADKPISTATQTALDGKASTSTVATLAGRVDTLETGLADTYNKAQIDTYLAAKADQATTYTKTETDTLLAGYVTLGTAQTIPGAKTFENNNTFKGQTLFERNDDQIKLINPNLEVGTMPSSSSLISTLLLCDKHGAYVGYVSHRMQTNGRGQGRIVAYNYDKSANAELTLNCDADGYKYGQVPNRPYANTTSSDIVNIALLDAYTPMVRTTGNQTKSGTMTFLDAIYGRLIDPLYEEYSGALPSGKYRIFARIPASNPNSMIVLDAMVSANGGNYGYGRMIIGNPTTTTWFCKWVLRKSGGFLSATSIQIAREVATGDLVVLALNPTYTGLAISLVYSKTGGSIHGAERVTKVTSSADYALDGTDTDLENIIPGSDMA